MLESDKPIRKIKEEGSRVTQEVKDRTLGFIVAAFGIVAGLAWNEAIKALIEIIFPKTENTLIAKFIYATIVTVVLVIVSLAMTRFFKKGIK